MKCALEDKKSHGYRRMTEALPQHLDNFNEEQWLTDDEINLYLGVITNEANKKVVKNTTAGHAIAVLT
jgi:hypothetical protein